MKNTNNKYIPQGGIYLISRIFKQFGLDSFINSCMPKRNPQARYQDSDLLLGLCYSIYSGGSYLEDLNRIRQQLLIPGEFELPSSDALTHRTKQLTVSDKKYVNRKTTTHFFNIPNRLNKVLLRLGVRLNPSWKKQPQIIDYDNTIISTRKGDSNFTYKNLYGYQPAAAFIGRNPIYIEGRNGNSNSQYKINETLKRLLELSQQVGIKAKALRIDGAAFQKKVFNLMRSYKDLTYYIRGKDACQIWHITSDGKIKKAKTSNQVALEYIDIPWYTPGEIDEEHECRLIIYRYKDTDQDQLDLFEGNYRYYCIYTNDYELESLEIIELYNKRGGEEQNFDRLKNDFNWAHPPFNNLSQNTVYLIFTAMAMVLYQWLLRTIGKHFTNLTLNTRIKRFIFIFVNVCVKPVYRGRRWILNIYTNKPYDRLLSGP